MFHVKHTPDDSPHPTPDVSRETRSGGPSSASDTEFAERAARLLEDLGATWSTEQIETLDRYGRWLIDEAIPAGGLGPDEASRIFDRHLADALMYLRGIPATASTMVDVGSGVGLPGIPVAIARPEANVTLLDRSERRTWLARRAVRVLSLANVAVVTEEATRPQPVQAHAICDVALFRASLPIPQAALAFRAMTSEAGIGLVGVSRLAELPEIPDPPSGVDFALTAEESSVLDSPFWLLRMRAV